MGTHDNIVEKATAMGKTSKDFTEAAQSHKKAIVFWLVLAIGVWFFWRLDWALLCAAVAVYETVQTINYKKVAGKLEKLETHG